MALSDKQAEMINSALPANQAVQLGTEVQTMVAQATVQAGLAAASALSAAMQFSKKVDLTAAAAATPVEILSDAAVGVGKKVYITNLLLSVGGATAWTDVTATVVTIQDTAAVNAVSVAKAQLTSQAQLGLLSAGVTLATPIRTGVGLTASKGITVKGDANFAAGSTITVTVTGKIDV
jgi:hypothetical protein